MLSKTVECNFFVFFGWEKAGFHKLVFPCIHLFKSIGEAEIRAKHDYPSFPLGTTSNFSVGNKMTGSHVTTHANLTLSIEVGGKPYFSTICPCGNVIVYDRFEDVGTFLYVFVSVIVFLR